MGDATLASSLLGTRGRRLGLSIFGVILVGIGIFDICALVSTGSRFHLNTVDVVGMAALKIGLGTGSIWGRRWARALAFCFGVYGFTQIIGIEVNALFIIPTNERLYFSLGMPPLLLWNVGLTWFYGLPSVKKTCELLDPIERWTDRCPLAVLTCCVWLFCEGLDQLTGLGKLLIETPGIWFSHPLLFALLLFALFTEFAAVGVYRMNRIVWGLYLAAFLLYSFSFFVPPLRHAFQELDASNAANAAIVWPFVSNTVIGLGYLLWARRSFAPGKFKGLK
jgi:hypothetical protein